jgi:hypothetical protein
VTVPAELTAKLASMVTLELAGPRTFSTGSKGFHATGKVTTEDGQRWQASANVTLIGSKTDESMTVSASRQDVAEKVALMVSVEGHERTFSSGNVGVFAQGKVVADGQRFQVTAQAVHITPKA